MLRSSTPPARVVVTGSSGGIGAAIAREFAAAGSSVWITYVSRGGDADDLAHECLSLGAPVAEVSRLDVASPDSIDGLVADVQRHWGSLTALVNNAGISPNRQHDDITLDEWAQVMDTNARSVFLVTRALLPTLRHARPEGEDRAVVNIASTAGQGGSAANGLHYAASKGAVLALSRTWAQILASERIRVNAVAPGPIHTDMGDALHGAAREQMNARILLGGFGSPEDVAPATVLLASTGSRFVTGATWDVNGGIRISS